MSRYKRITFSGVDYLDKGMNRLKELEDMIENGLLIVSPCKYGDTLYFVYTAEQKEPIKIIVKEISAKTIDGELCWFAFDELGYGGRVGLVEGLDWWYLGADKTEAERRLAQLQAKANVKFL